MPRPAWITACCAWMDCGRGGGDCGAAGAAAHACEGDRGCCGREADAAGTSATGALDAGWTVWMRQNRAPRLAVNAYNRYLISSRDWSMLI
jgi:hypothetical protein